MSEFEVLVTRINAIEQIENADSIEVAVVGEYRSIVQKGKFNTNDLVVYIPEQAIIPDWLIERLGLTGKLSGKSKNRVKAIKLRGVLSQGLIYKLDTDFVGYTLMYTNDINEPVSVKEGQDVKEFLGIIKYEPEMDVNTRRKFNGQCVYIPGKTVKYDVENWKKYSRLLNDGETVIITEKIHGTMCCFASYPDLGHHELPNDCFVYSKGLGAKGEVFKWSKDNEDNTYIKAFNSLTLTWEYGDGIVSQTIAERMRNYFPPNTPAFIFGEIFGSGIQDLRYGMEKPVFRAFDIWVGTPSNGKFLDACDKYRVFKTLGVEHVPVLYSGPYSKEKLLELTDGVTMYNGANIREGVVVTPIRERVDSRHGRVCLKNVSEAYLLRKNGTEWN